MSNRSAYSSRIPIAYAASVFALFVWIYVVRGVREMGLYLALLWLNLPASLLVVPWGEKLALASCYPAGGPWHVWGTQAAAVVANTAMIALCLGLSRVTCTFMLRRDRPFPLRRN
jgi:hypothetical protein